MARMTINGVTIEVPDGQSIHVVNNTIMVGDQVVRGQLSGIVDVRWEGPIQDLFCDASVSCQNVQGNLKAAGSVECGNVGGDIKAGGSVQCGKVAGSVKAGGSIMGV
jgi:hypothetical protein